MYVLYLEDTTTATKKKKNLLGKLDLPDLSYVIIRLTKILNTTKTKERKKSFPSFFLVKKVWMTTSKTVTTTTALELNIHSF